MVNMNRVIIVIALLATLVAMARAGEGGADNWKGTPQEAFLNSEIVQNYQCTACHQITERGGTVGPILNQVANRRSKDWLQRWLSDPQQVKPGTKMPNFDFPPDQLKSVVNYLSNMKRELRTDEIIAKDVPVIEKGQLLFEDYGCVGCHRIGTEGRFVGPDLTWIGIRKTEEWEKVWLQDPPDFKPGTFMPNFHIPQKGIEALAAYLQTQRGAANDESQAWEFRTNFFLGNSEKERGELVFKRFACWSCHGESATGGIRNPNMAPDEMMPALKKVTNDYTLAEFGERLKKRIYPESLDSGKSAPPFFCPDYGNYMDQIELEELYAYLQSFAPKKSKWRFK